MEVAPKAPTNPTEAFVKKVVALRLALSEVSPTSPRVSTRTSTNKIGELRRACPSRWSSTAPG